ncbi:MAG: RnfABCDGE type electron transport complex subunit [Bacillota bacterium]|jgi:electron transport complex protein RnfG|nr:RnfABCDGE type electron transport complex subunit [Bacillota bacterium]
MKNNMIVKLGAVLCIVSAIAAGILAYTNDATKEKIAIAEEMASSGPEVAQAVIPNSATFELLDDTALIDKIKSENPDFIEIRINKDASGNQLGYGIRTFSPTPGYAGKVEIFLGVSLEGKILGMKIVSMKETAGLGTKIGEPKFQTQFLNRDTASEIKVSKSNPKENEILALTGATRSSKSFTSAVNNAMTIYNEYLKK